MVTGLGAVGLSAVMAAKVAGCKKIVGIDRIANRLELAKELGATGVIDTSAGDVDVSFEVKKLIPGGPSIAIDASGYTPLVTKAWEYLGKMGKLVVVGGGDFAAKLDVTLIDLMLVCDHLSVFDNQNRC